MGPSTNTGSCTRTDKHTLPGISPQRDPALSGPKQTISRGDKDTTREKAVSVVPPPAEGGFISRMFVIPIKGGRLRPIIDLRDLNKFIHW